MYLKQLAIFIENREGRLKEVLACLKDKNINIISLSLADTADYGMLRMIVSNPDQALNVLKENEFTAMLSDVLAFQLAHKAGQLQELLELICSAGINIEYMYALATGNDDASIVIKTSDLNKALEILEQEEVTLITQKDIQAMG